MDACANAIAIIGFVLRFFEVTWETARVLYCVNFVIFSLRLFRMYFVSGYLGPKIIMIKRMVSYFYRGYYTVGRRYEFYFRVAKQYFTNERSKWVKYCFCHEKIKFTSSSRRVMFFLLYRQKDFDKIIEGNYRNYIIYKLTCQIIKPLGSRM